MLPRNDPSRTHSESVARHNRAHVLRLIRRSGGMARAELAEASGLTATSLTRIGSVIIKSGIVSEAGEPDRRPLGRPRTRLVLNKDWGHVITVGLHHTLTVGVVDMGGNLIRQERVCGCEPHKSGFYRGMYGPDYEKTIQDAVAGVLADEGDRRILGIGVSSFGEVNRSGHIMRHYHCNDADLDVQSILSPVTDLPVFTDHEVRLLLLSHIWDPDTPHWQNALLLMARCLGEAGGHAAVVDNMLLRGAHGYVGECINHLPRWHKTDAEYQSDSDLITTMGGVAEFVAHVEANDPAAVEVYQRGLKSYGLRIANLSHSYDPEVLLLYSPYAALGERFLADIRKEVAYYVHPAIARDLEVRICGHRSDDERLKAAAIPILSNIFVDGQIAPPPEQFDNKEIASAAAKVSV
jgi:predicted NBD/HSP70 family sugar kinase